MNSFSYTIPSREEILALLRSAKSVTTIESLSKSLRVKKTEMEGFLRRITAMERDGQIKCDSQGELSIVANPPFSSGRVSGHRDGFGFLITDDGSPDVFLPESEMQKVLHGDRVQVRLNGVDKRGRLEGSIVEILQRANTHIIGRLLKENGVFLIAPEDKRIRQDILLAGLVGHAKVGQVVSVELIEQPSRHTNPSGKIVEVLGEIDDPGMEIEIAVRKFGVPHIFPHDALKLAQSLPDEVLPADLKDRIDLRDIPMLTIDGEDARDFDDAVYCEPVKIGGSYGFRLIVAIADVSHYVKPGDALDLEALNRSTSVYFPRRVIPMLPEKLSNGLCSLNPQVDRLTLVCDAVITNKGEIKAYQFYQAVIHSVARLTYTEVSEILTNTNGPQALKRANLIVHLQNLYDLFSALLKARHARGAIDFETTETYIVCTPSGKIEKIIPRVRNDAHRIIEECMLAANVCAADLLKHYKHPSIYRIHASPSTEKLSQLRTFLKQVNLNLAGGDTPTALDYSELLAKIKQRPDATLLQTMLLRSMQLAVYSPDNISHFGLAYEAYTHFTSPIRRYPDLLIHRAIKAVLSSKKYNPAIDQSTLNTDLSPAARKQIQKDHKTGKSEKSKIDSGVWDALGLHCSANERRADEASRDVQAWLKCYFIRDKLGEQFSGTVSGVTSFGIFVQLDTLFIEGLVHITELGGSDYYQYDEVRHELRGERSGRCYQLTDHVTAQVIRVDLEARKIDLRLVDSDSLGALKIDAAPEKLTSKKGKKRVTEESDLAPPVRASKTKRSNKEKSKTKSNVSEKTPKKPRKKKHR